MRRLLMPACVLVATACAPFNSLHQVRDAGYQVIDIYSQQIGAIVDARGEQAGLDAGLDALRRVLKDPDSAKISNTRVVQWRSGKVVCGEVNAKNSYGGYVGNRPFVAGSTRATLWDTSSRHKEILDASNAALREACL